jgi:hypothetical protein
MHCSAYCEVRNYFFYGQEVLFTEFSGCRVDSACSFTSTKALTISQSHAFNLAAPIASRSEYSPLSERQDDRTSILEFGFNIVRPFELLLCISNVWCRLIRCNRAPRITILQFRRHRLDSAFRGRVILIRTADTGLCESLSRLRSPILDLLHKS